MIAPLAAKLQIHEDELDLDVEPRGEVVVMPGVDRGFPPQDTTRVVHEATWSRVPPSGVLHRRLLAAANMLVVALGVILTRTVSGPRRVALAAVALPLVIFPFQIAGLYDRDELRPGPSTLDEVSALMQLTALFALGATILKLPRPWLARKRSDRGAVARRVRCHGRGPRAWSLGGGPGLAARALLSARRVPARSADQRAAGFERGSRHGCGFPAAAMTMLGVRQFRLSHSSRLIKRGFDQSAVSLGMANRVATR